MGSGVGIPCRRGPVIGDPTAADAVANHGPPAPGRLLVAAPEPELVGLRPTACKTLAGLERDGESAPAVVLGPAAARLLRVRPRGRPRAAAGGSTARPARALRALLAAFRFLAAEAAHPPRLSHSPWRAFATRWLPTILRTPVPTRTVRRPSKPPHKAADQDLPLRTRAVAPPRRHAKPP